MSGVEVSAVKPLLKFAKAKLKVSVMLLFVDKLPNQHRLIIIYSGESGRDKASSPLPHKQNLPTNKMVSRLKHSNRAVNEIL